MYFFLFFSFPKYFVEILWGI